MEVTFTDTELLTYLKTKNQAAEIYLYEKYAGALYGIVLNAINNKEKSAEILEESFKSIFRNIHDFHPHKNRLFTWMLKITKSNIALYADPIQLSRGKSFRTEENSNINDLSA